MRKVDVGEIGLRLKTLARETAWRLGAAEQAALRRLRQEEVSPAGQWALEALAENCALAEREARPLCQDTGLAIVFLEIGQEVQLAGGDLETAVNTAIREAYREERLRNSVLDDPLLRRNTGDNTPAMLHTQITPGDRVRIYFCAKGGGCENCSRFRMLKPSSGREGVIGFVTEAVREAGGRPCPPLVVGVWLGGSFEKCAWLAKKALFRPLNQPNPRPHLAELEKDLLASLNRTGVGPLGLGGRCTTLAVHVEAFACHIASLPVAVNLDCHSHRHGEAVL